MKRLNITIVYSLIVLLPVLFVMAILGGVYCGMVQPDVSTGICAEGLLPWIVRNVKQLFN